MAGCCDDNCAVEALQERQRGTLLAVLGINAVMFVVMILAAYAAGSTALLADSLDNLGDALTYGLSLLVVSGTALMNARSPVQGRIDRGCDVAAGRADCVSTSRSRNTGIRADGCLQCDSAGRQWMLPCTPVAPSRGGHQHVLGLGMLKR